MIWEINNYLSRKLLDILSYLAYEKELKERGYNVEFSRKADFMFSRLGANYKNLRNVKLPKFGENGWLR